MDNEIAVLDKAIEEEKKAIKLLQMVAAFLLLSSVASYVTALNIATATPPVSVSSSSSTSPSSSNTGQPAWLWLQLIAPHLIVPLTAAIGLPKPYEEYIKRRDKISRIELAKIYLTEEDDTAKREEVFKQVRDQILKIG